jgi:hypothetical protein
VGGKFHTIPEGYSFPTINCKFSVFGIFGSGRSKQKDQKYSFCESKARIFLRKKIDRIQFSKAKSVLEAIISKTGKSQIEISNLISTSPRRICLRRVLDRLSSMRREELNGEW